MDNLFGDNKGNRILKFDEIENYDKTRNEDLVNTVEFLFYDLRDKKGNPIDPVAKQSSKHMVHRHQSAKNYDKFYNGPVQKGDVKLFRNKYTKARDVFATFYQPANVTHYEKYIKENAMSQLPKGFVMFEKVVFVEEIVFAFRFLKSHSQKIKDQFDKGIVKIKHTSPDLIENLNKPIWDALEGVVIKNDGMIGSAEKLVKIYAPVSYIYIKLRGI